MSSSSAVFVVATAKSSALTFFLVALCALLLLCTPSPVSATTYIVQAILPLSGSNSAQFAQWRSAIQQAASEVSTAWAPSDALQVDFYDYAGDSKQLFSIGAAAVSNASVTAVLTDDQGAKGLSAFASFKLPLLVVPSASQLSSSSSTAGAYTYTMQSPYSVLNSLQALLAQYNWNRVGLLYSADDDGLVARDAILSIPGLNVTALSVPIDSVDQSSFINSIIRLRITVIIIANKRSQQVSNFTTNPIMSVHSAKTGTTVVYLNLVGSLPTYLYQGSFSIDAADATAANQATFEGTLGVSSLEKGSLTAYDAVKVLAAAISAASSSGPVNHDTVAAALGSINYSGVSGQIQFDTDGNRISQLVEIWNANSTVNFGSLNLSMTYDGTSITQLLPPTFPDNTFTPTNAQTIWIPIVISLQLTSNIIPSGSRDRLKATFNYYIYYINQHPELLPANSKLVPIIFDNLGTPAVAVQDAIIASNIGAAAVFGDYSATMTAVTQSVVSAFGIPQMTTVTSSSLSSDDLYPTLTRAVSVTDSEGDMILGMAQQNGWTELSIISTSDSFGSDAASVLLNSASASGITIQHHLVLGADNSTYFDQLNTLFASKPQILVILTVQNTFPFLQAMHATGYRPAAVVTDILATLDTNSYAAAVGVPEDMFEGWVSIHTPVGVGQAWTDFLTNATNAAIADPVTWGIVPVMVSHILSAATEMDSFMVIAQGIKKIAEEQGLPATDGAALLTAIREFQGTLFSGEINFGSSGDRVPTFDLFNNINGALINRGRWTQATGLVLNDKIIWPSGTTNIPASSLPRTMKWLKWSDGAGIVFGILAAIGICVCFAMLIVIYTWRESPIITSSTYEFLILMLFGAALGFGSTFTWIGKPQPYICGLRIWLPPLAFLLIIAPLMAKTWRLWKIFSLKNLRVRPVSLLTLIIIVTAMILVQIIICIFWISMGTVQPTIVNDPNDSTVAYVLCKTIEANRIASYVTFGYIGLVLVVGCYLAYKIRKLPKDFNESKWIGRTLYNVFMFAGLIIILGYALSRFYIVVLILICVCTLAICYGSIMLMMAPKIWTLIRHPEKRSSSEGSTKNTDGSAVALDSVNQKDWSRSRMGNSTSSPKTSKNRSLESKNSAH